MVAAGPLQLTDLWGNIPLVDVPKAIKAQLQQEGVHSPYGAAHLECPVWVNGEAVPLDPTGHLLH